MSGQPPGDQPPHARTMCYCAERPAAFWIYNGQLPVCMPCYEAFMRASDIQQRQAERHLNFLQDQMGFITGIPGLGARYPEEQAPIHFQPVVTNNNIRVSNSTVGAINTGQVAHLNVLMTGIEATNPALAEGLTRFANAAVNEPTLSAPDREELLTLIEAVSEAATKPPSPKSKLLMMPWLARIGAIAASVEALLEIWDRVKPLFH